MRKSALLVFAVLLALTWAAMALAVSPEKPTIGLKAGDEVYACACGAACPCKTLSMNAGKCSCGVDMAKSKVVSVKDGKAVITVNGKDEEFPLKGKFVCGCGEACPCNTVSQKPGKCSCGKDLVPAKS